MRNVNKFKQKEGYFYFLIKLSFVWCLIFKQWRNSRVNTDTPNDFFLYQVTVQK